MNTSIKLATKAYHELRRVFNHRKGTITLTDLEMIDAKTLDLLYAGRNFIFCKDLMEGLRDLRSEIECEKDAIKQRKELLKGKEAIKRRHENLLSSVKSLFDISGYQEGSILKSVERDVVINAVKLKNGNRAKAARYLGLSYKGLVNKLNLYISEGYIKPEDLKRC